MESSALEPVAAAALALNYNEQQVVDVLRGCERALTLRQIADTAFSSLDPDRAHSWARNSIRKPLRLGIVERADRGTYQAKRYAPTPLPAWLEESAPEVEPVEVPRPIPPMRGERRVAGAKHRGTSSSDKRGNTVDRARRREWMIKTFGSPSGKTIDCTHCGKRMRTDTKVTTWEVDRFPICGHMGGKYVRGNIAPACASCNRNRCQGPAKKAACAARVGGARR